MNYMELIRQRYSCRRFADRPVETEKIETIIEAGHRKHWQKPGP